MRNRSLDKFLSAFAVRFQEAARSFATRIKPRGDTLRQMIYYNLPRERRESQRRFALERNEPIEAMGEMGYYIAVNLRTREKFVYTTAYYDDEAIAEPADDIHGPYDRREVFDVRLRDGTLPQYVIKTKSSPHKSVDRKDSVQEIDHHNAITLFDLCDGHHLPRPHIFGFSMPERRRRASPRRTPLDWPFS